LLGRNLAGLQWLFQNREFSIPDLVEQGPVTIKTLDPVWQKQLTGEETLQPVMQALRELIA
jgi:hypothetical protein